MICNKVEKCIEEQLVNQKTTACVNKNIECIEVSDNRSRIKCEERKKKYILENTRKDHVILYKMDGGIIPQDKSVRRESANVIIYLYLEDRNVRLF